MWTKVLLIAIGIAGLGIIVVLINELRLERAHARLVTELLSDREARPPQVFQPEVLEDLPAPVQRYLRKAIPDGQPYVKVVRLRQTGEFRLGDRTSPWKPFSAEQTFTTTPPGFVWDASIKMAPLVPVRVVDMYKSGQGALQARILSTLAVADARGAPELDEGELMRYLGESAWFPTALLPGQGVTWTAIDDRSARATIEHGGTRASLIFTFNARDEVESIHAPGRARQVNSGYEPTPWTGYWRNYQERNGMLIPTQGEVAWNLPDGDLTYWRAHLEAIDYETAE
ncbi:MAG: hypothetical protein Kow0063_37860 [Anaerolineae bacterium]